MTCTHTKEHSRWVTTNYFGEEIEGKWEYTTESTTVDIDVHRYKCTMCNKIFYYSARAHDYYEKGIKSEWFVGVNT